jgi:D-3-phosphoglycerate dehydrogenase
VFPAFCGLKIEAKRFRFSCQSRKVLDIRGHAPDIHAGVISCQSWRRREAALTAAHGIFLTHSITQRTYWYGEQALERLQALAPVSLNPRDEVLSSDEFIERAKGCSVIVLDRQSRIGAREMEHLPDLVAIVRSGVDIRHIDVEAASERGILVTRTNAGYVASTAELVLAHILNAARRIPDYVAAYRAGDLHAPVSGRELSGSTVGLIGYGRIGRHLARILDAMGVNVVAYDPYAQIDAPASAATLDDLMKTSDFVVPLVVASEDTLHLIDAAKIAAMKPDAWLVNCSRGDVVDEAALIDALDRKAIAGAAMDVGWGEDHLPTPEVARRPDVFATPHIGNLTREALEKQPLDTVLQSASILKGETPFGTVNLDRAHRFTGKPNGAA